MTDIMKAIYYEVIYWSAPIKEIQFNPKGCVKLGIFIPMGNHTYKVINTADIQNLLKQVEIL